MNLVVREAGKHEFDERNDNKRRDRKQENAPLKKSDEHADAVWKESERHEPEDGIDRQDRIPKIALHAMDYIALLRAGE